MQVFWFIPTIGDGRYLGDRRFDSEGQRRMAAREYCQAELHPVAWH
jgi:hypothetical protein